MLGVVLCGGKSSRMGADKGLLKQHSQSWAYLAKDKLVSLGLRVKISVNKEQFTAYSSHFSPADLIPDYQSLDIRGPLCGVMSAHLDEPTQDLFILACDMPLMESFVLRELLQISVNYAGPDAFVFKNDNEPEPLCGIYKATALARIFKLYEADQLYKHSMKFMLDHLDTFTTAIPEENKKYFRNFNAHAELNGL